MSSVSLNTIMNDFRKFDINGDGKLTKGEIAQAALTLIGNGQTTEGELFATFVEGGVNHQGLLPDQDGDGSLSLQELQNFAAKGPDPTQISTATFQNYFGSQATGGQSLPTDQAINQLSTIASQNSSMFNVDPNNPTAIPNGINWLNNQDPALTGINQGNYMPQTGIAGYPSIGQCPCENPSGISPNMIMQFFGMMLQFMQMCFGGQQQPGCQPYQPGPMPMMTGMPTGML